LSSTEYSQKASPFARLHSELKREHKKRDLRWWYDAIRDGRYFQSMKFRDVNEYKNGLYFES